MREAFATSLIEFTSNQQMQKMVGPNNENITELELLAGVSITQSGNQISIAASSPEKIEKTRRTLEKLYAHAAQYHVDKFDIQRFLEEERTSNSDTPHISAINLEHLRGKKVIPKSTGQRAYIQALHSCKIVFAVGVAGTGKTFLATAFALEKLKKNEVKRIVLVRPAIEAGEKLGFLPGTLQEKITPYMQPFYDAFHHLLPLDVIQKKIDAQEIEIAPLAYMRGRTLSHSFILVDEAQNITHTQMKMLLTRLGENAHMVIAGDPSQLDIMTKESGFLEATQMLKNIHGIQTVHLDESSCIRHPLVKKIIDAYRGKKQK